MKQLNIDEMLEAAREADMPTYRQLVALVEATANVLAREVSDFLGVKCGEAKWEGLDMAGTCSAFSPLFEGQQIPKVLLDLDEGGDWEFDDEDDVIEEQLIAKHGADCACLACDLAQAVIDARKAYHGASNDAEHDALFTLIGLLEQNGDAIRKALSK